ncbi:MAG: PEP-CTERM sorting domain-containing protein [Verrucomicrobiota bacterium]
MFTTPYFTSAKGACLGIVLGLAGLVSAPAQQFLSLVGDQNSTNDEIYLIDLTNFTSQKLLDVGFGRTNAFDWVEEEKVAFFTTQTDQGVIYMYDALNNSITTVSGPNLGVSDINGGAFYDGAYWFIPNGASDLYRVEIDLTDRTSPSYTSGDITVYSNFNGLGITYTFGDISVNDSGILFGTNTTGDERLFSVDISATGSGGVPTDYVDDVGSIPESMQIGFDEVTGELYAVNTNDSQWFTISTSDATRTPVEDGGGDPFFGPVDGFTRDITGFVVALPEPTSAALLVGAMALLTLRRRRR